MAKVQLFQWGGLPTEEEVEVEVAPGMNFDELDWLMETSYREARWRLRCNNNIKRFTLFSPPHYRVTSRDIGFNCYAHHGWTDTAGDGSLEVPCCRTCGRVLECPVCNTSAEKHWDCEKKPYCMVCQAEFRNRKPIEDRDPPRISLKTKHEGEVEVRPGLSFNEVAASTAYRETRNKSRVTIFSPPHNRVRKTQFGNIVHEELLHPFWMKTEDIQLAATEVGSAGAVCCPTCPIIFKDALVLDCGHSINKHLVNDFWGKNEEPPCPACFQEVQSSRLKRKRSSSMDIPVNLQEKVKQREKVLSPPAKIKNSAAF